MPEPTIPITRPRRLPLGATRRRLSFERRVRLWLTVLALPPLLLTAALVFREGGAIPMMISITAVTAMSIALASSFLFEQITRPLQTLSNVVAALREDDFSFRARGARRGDSLGDLALEINALASTLQQQRSAALDARTLVELVLTSMRSPVLAFDDTGCLRLSNNAARTTFSLSASSVGQPAFDLNLAALLTAENNTLYPAQSVPAPLDAPRWSVARVTFRLDGLPHTLLVLSDIAPVLREEERSAWQRLIRVLGHEINNSLTPIQSIAASLRSRILLNPADPQHMEDLTRGLAIIEDRSVSLNRFLHAYQQLLRLPPPRLRPTELAPLLAQVAELETRLAIHVHAGPAITLSCDPDQIQQALINLVKNAADAALAPDNTVFGRMPEVSLSWIVTPCEVLILLEDNGSGVANPANLFVPFYTTKPNGSGIGLVLAQQILEAHGGNISLSPRLPDLGTKVEVRLLLQSAELDRL